MEGGRQHRKNRFLRIHIEILQLGLNMIKMALQWKSKWVSPSRVQHPLSRFSMRKSPTPQQANYLRYAHSQHIESHLGKKQQQAKIPRAFLFSKLHFNKVTSDATIFHGGHYLVMRSNWEMRSAKPANHLNTGIPYFLTNVSTSSPVLIWLPSTPKMIRMLYISGTL